MSHSKREKMNKSKNLFQSSEILRIAFWDHKQKDTLSLRKWAKLCGVDSSTLTLILNSKRLAPRKHLKKIAQSLNFDLLKQSQLENAYRNDLLKIKGINQNISMFDGSEKDIYDIYEVIEGDAILLKNWFYIALLEYSLCKDFKEDYDFLAKKFLLSKSEIQIALHELEQEGYLVRKNGILKKQNKKMRIPTTRSRQLIRNFHIQMLEKAKHQLQSKSDKESFEKRLMTGYTISANTKQLSKAKLLLEKALLEVSKTLSQGEPNEVYQLQFQLFPLTN